MSDNGDNGHVTITINGQEVRTQERRLLIDVAEELGIFVPRFCYHPGMRSVAVCRMCLVKVEGQGKLMPACATPVQDGMKVDTEDPEAVDAQAGMLEFLLINHPLDCPICDRGGECPLQDQTYRHGPGSSRYIEPKRTFEKPIAISDLVVLDRERCVLCWRCVRFADEVAGDRFIQLVDRGPGTQILTFSDEPFDSYFSGNTIQICPVGALTAKTYRFVSRPWDLETAPSVCGYCAVGCPLTNESRWQKLVRCQALPNENVNDFWICDKGRFGHHYVESDERLITPLLRDESEQFQQVSWGRALEVIGERLQGKKRVGVIAGGHLTTEDAYAVARLAKKVIGTRDVDSRLQDAGAPYELALELGGVAGSNASLNDLDQAQSILWVGPDPKEALPVLYLRLRRAVVDGDARLTVVAPRRISLDDFANEVVRCDAGEEAGALEDLGARLEGSSGGFIACWGPSSPGRDETEILRAVIALTQERDGKLLVCPPHAGSQGMIDMGVYPSLDAGYARVAEPGRDTRGILQAAAAGELDALMIFGADPIADFPDARLAERALQSSPFTVVIELFATETAARADVVLPSAAYSERDGTFTNLERRLQKLEALNVPPGTATEPWKACVRIAATLGDEWGWRDCADVWEQLRQEVPTHAQISLEALTQEPPRTVEGPHARLGFMTKEAASRPLVLAGPGGQYPKGFRAGAPFQTGHNWPLSWELRAFEASQRPGLIPPAPDGESRNGESSSTPLRSALEGLREGVRRVAKGLTEGGPAAGPSETEARASRRFLLYAGRMIYDEGAMVSKSAALRGLQKKPFVEIHPDDAAALGLEDGAQAIVTGPGFEGRARVAIADIARGAVFVPYDQEGLPANRLMTGSNPTVEVRPA